jgi:hypothetical protein
MLRLFIYSLNFNDFLRVIGAISTSSVAILNLVHHFHPLNYLSKHRMVTIEPGCGNGGEEELRAAGVRARIRHREQSGAVVALGQGGWLARNLPSRTTSSSSAVSWITRMWATALNHEVLDHTVKVKTVVESFIHEFEEVVSSPGAIFSVETYRDLACTRLHLHYSRHGSVPALSAQEHMLASLCNH